MLLFNKALGKGPLQFYPQQDYAFFSFSPAIGRKIFCLLLISFVGWLLLLKFFLPVMGVEVILDLAYHVFSNYTMNFNLK